MLQYRQLKAEFFLYNRTFFIFFLFISFTLLHADEGEWTFKPFATLLGTYNDANGTTVPALETEQQYLESNQADFRDSIIGLQTDYLFNDYLSFTIQGVATNFHKSSYTERLEWCYFSLDTPQDLHLRMGQLKIPYLSGNELRFIGYSRLWIRPAVPFDSAGGFDDFLGAELLWRSYWGDTMVQLQAAAGGAENQDERVDHAKIAAFAIKIDDDEGSWINISLLSAQYDFLPTPGAALIEKNFMLMGSIEAKLQFEQTELFAGYSYGQADELPTEEFYYLSAGYRIGVFTPYILYSNRDYSHETPDGSIVIDSHKESLGLGARLDIYLGHALKAEWNRQHEDSPQSGISAFNYDSDIFSFAWDMVF